jgi:hypothetical protein
MPDVDAGHPDRLTRRREPKHVAELAERDQRRQLTHAVEAHQRLATGLAASELAQLALERGDLGLDGIDHP